MWISKKKYEEEKYKLEDEAWKERAEFRQNLKIERLVERVAVLEKEVKKLKKQIREGY